VPDGDRPSQTWRELVVASFFEGAPQEFITWATPRLAASTRDLRVSAGERLYRADEPADRGYFVVSGSVRLDKPGFPSWILSDRALVGMIDSLLERPRSREAIAVTALHLLEIPVSEWFEVMEDSVEMAMRGVDGIATDLLPLLRRAPGAVARALTDEGPPPVSLNLVDQIVALRRVRCLQRAGVQTLATLAAHAEPVYIGPGDAPVSVRIENRAMFMIAHGEMEVTYDTSKVKERFGAGEMVGGATAFVEGAAFAASATRPTLLLKVLAEDWFDVMEEHFDLTRSIVSALVLEREELMNAAASAARAQPLSMGAPA
jgi:CRP-like cAMP-binding protein